MKTTDFSKQAARGLATLCLWAVSMGAAVGATSTNANGTDFPSFRIIAERNIFDASRTGVRVFTSRGSKERVVRYETFSLLGTMSYEKGTFAFFDGSSSEFRKTLKPMDSIGSFKLVGVAPNYVRLLDTAKPRFAPSTNAAPVKPIELRVGMQMRHEAGGPWSLAGQATPSASAPAAASSTGDKSDSKTDSDASASGGSVSDAMKRLMLKREQEDK